MPFQQTLCGPARRAFFTALSARAVLHVGRIECGNQGPTFCWRCKELATIFRNGSLSMPGLQSVEKG